MRLEACARVLPEEDAHDLHGVLEVREQIEFLFPVPTLAPLTYRMISNGSEGSQENGPDHFFRTQAEEIDIAGINVFGYHCAQSQCVENTLLFTNRENRARIILKKLLALARC